MYGTLVFSNTSIASTDGVVSFNHHTSAVHVLNTNTTTNATVRLNGVYSIVIPHIPSQSQGAYVCIPGDYTNIEVLTANVSVAVFAIG